tara:strand:- start:2098 stop:2496 length:399 start_codon:yes stop_codon:yes gene_type:complete
MADKWYPHGWEETQIQGVLSEEEVAGILRSYNSLGTGVCKESLHKSFNAWWVRNVLSPVKKKIKKDIPPSVKGEWLRECVARELAVRVVQSSALRWFGRDFMTWVDLVDAPCEAFAPAPQDDVVLEEDQETN